MSEPAARALVVEDDGSWQQLLSEILADAGLAVDVAGSLEEAVDSLRAAPHRLAVVDLSLSEGEFANSDGLRVLDAVRRHDPGCVSVLLTGFATVELAVSVLTEYGALSCLRKETFDRQEFRRLVARALAGAPATVREAEESRPELAEAAEAGGGTEACARALAVEDDAGWRSILSELLAEAGYAVHLCASFGEALGRLRRERYDLAVIDLSLGGPEAAGLDPWGRGRGEEDLEGYRLLDTVRAAGMPAIVVSGVATPGEIERAYAERGIYCFLEKQAFDRRAFLRTVEEARAAAGVGGELDCLTPREREVLELLARGSTNKEIAAALFISGNTVKRHLKAIFAKLDVHTRSAAAARAVSAGVVVERVGE